MPTRTFFAMDLDELLRDALIQAQDALANSGAKLRPVDRSNLHVTLVFLGDVADGLLGEALTVAAEAAASVEPFDFQMAGLSAVPPRGEVRMVWANVADPTGRMKLLQDRLTDALGGMGLRQEERAFHPHITLARIKFADDPPRFRRSVDQLANQDFGTQHAEELTAYSSTLTPTGPVYTALARYRLGE
ncbi:MAG: RNA 2',3'-cyclic phosphodiesterase [Phycisphaerae bacterium]|nr:RNA 2',3'-cyclic phosphodiesterase [Phycisphaerae bacterium]